MSMTRAEAREFLLSIANKLGYIGVEDLTDKDGKRMIEAIKALEEPQWIPCSERLPGEYMSFYATVKSLIDNRERWVIEGMYTTLWEWGKIPMIDNGEAKVIAWMPKDLPEAWRGDAE